MSRISRALSSIRASFTRRAPDAGRSEGSWFKKKVTQFKEKRAKAKAQEAVALANTPTAKVKNLSTRRVKNLFGKFGAKDLKLKGKADLSALLTKAASLEGENISLVRALLQKDVQVPRDLLLDCLEGKLSEKVSRLIMGVVVSTDINAKDESGQTPLHAAIFSRSNKCVKALIEEGADVKVRDGSGQTPLQLAIELGNLEVVKLLIDKGADTSEKLVKKCLSGEITGPIAEVLVQTRKNKLLCVAVVKGNAALVKQFLEVGADVNTVNREGRTLLNEVLGKILPEGKDYVVSDKSFDKGFAIVNVLLDAGARVSLEDCTSAGRIYGLGSEISKALFAAYDKQQHPEGV